MKSTMTNSKPILKAVFPGKYIQGEGLIRELQSFMNPYGEKSMILASGTAQNILNQHIDKFEHSNMHVEKFRGECCEPEIQRVSELVVNHKTRVLAGMGGGKVIDTAKIVADRAGIPVIIVPTIASSDAPCSGCAVIYSEDGIFQSVYYQKSNPQEVIVDMDVMAAAPVRFLVSGMGDALATWFEARSCERTQSMNACGGYSTRTGLALAKLCYDMILKYGRLAKMANEQGIITPALNHIVEANILLSGTGFESSGLAAAHSIHNGLSVLEEAHAYYHGEKVAFGVLTGLHLTGTDPGEIDTVYAFCESVGLPVTFAELGLAGVTRTRLMKAAVKACEPGESIHHEVGQITPEKVLAAMIAANAMGQERKLQFNLNNLKEYVK